jgi:hypothetical protein
VAFDAGAAAAVVAAAVVTWQSWDTRKSAQASRAAVDAANDGLELTRQQAAEAVRARIDAATPRVTVTMPAAPTWPPLQPSLYAGGHPQPYPIGLRVDPLLTPRDADLPILVRTPVTVINESDAHVRLEIGELTTEDGASLIGPLVLAPRERYEALFAVTRTLAGWIEVFQARAEGGAGETAVGLRAVHGPCRHRCD